MIRNEKTRQYIIKKAALIFNKKGYVGTYLSDLTNATGLTKGSIYGNFKDKNEVALESFKYNYALQTEPLLEMVEKEENSSKKLLAFLNHFEHAYHDIFKNGGCAIVNTAVDADNGNEALRKEVKKKINEWSHKLIQILDEGIREKELKPIDSKAFSFQMISMIEGSILIAKTLGEPDILLNNLTLLKNNVMQLKLN